MIIGFVSSFMCWPLVMSKMSLACCLVITIAAIVLIQDIKNTQHLYGGKGDERLHIVKFVILA